ncbi:MAG: hypothetical protein ABFS35_01290 [Bacteroidota bacterium]
MKISGFSMGKNVGKLYYPVKESIMSVLPMVDEFIFALGDCDEDDNTLAEIESIGSDKIKIIHTKWDIEKYPRGMEHAHQSNIAKEQCSGDWLIYIQNDELIHEKYHEGLRNLCQKHLDDKTVEGFLFDYKHFWGDYDHYHFSHQWYKKEIRIIRNNPEIYSWESAQSFRRIPGFEGLNFRQQKGTYKLKVVNAGADIYHYGWVRPPKLMKAKNKAFMTNHLGAKEANARSQGVFSYGPLNKLQIFKETHPAVLSKWIEKFDWKDQLQYDGPLPTNRPLYRHERLKYRIISWIENNILGGRTIGGFKNYILLKNKN